MDWRDISQDLTTELNDIFGDEIIFSPKGRDISYPLIGIYDEESTDFSIGSLEVNSYTPTLRIDKKQFSDIGAPPPKADDGITISLLGKSFYISEDPRDNGFSEYIIKLSKTIGGSFAQKRRY